MSSAFKNFFITFSAGLLVFGLIGWLLIYPALKKIPGDSSDTSEDEISDTSTLTSVNSGDVSKETVIVGNTFTAMFIGKASDGLAASVIYMRANEGTKTFSYCFIPTETLVGNNIGKNEPIKYLFAQVDGSTAVKKLSALVGVNIDYYAVLGTDELAAIADKLINGKFNLANEIRYPDPANQGTEDTSAPEITVPAGENKLNGDLVRKIMSYNPANGEEYHVLAKQLYETVFTQFLTDPGTKKNSKTINSLFSVVKNTNINAAEVEKDMDLIFSFDSYKPKEIKFASGSEWSKILPLFRD